MSISDTTVVARDDRIVSIVTSRAHQIHLIPRTKPGKIDRDLPSGIRRHILL